MHVALSTAVIPADETAVSDIAAAIGEPARARILFSLMDDRARSSTELAVVARVSPSTASVHLQRLLAQHLIKVLQQGKHRYYRLAGPDVAATLEALSVLAGVSRQDFVPTTPSYLRAARTCYDHLAGALGVALHDRLRALAWLAAAPGKGNAYRVTPKGHSEMIALGIDVEKISGLRRRVACPCLDWSERRPHLGGALGAAFLQLLLKRKWLSRELDSRALVLTALGRRELPSRFGLTLA